MTNPDIREGDDDNEWWHRGVGVENDLFNGHYRENPINYSFIFYNTTKSMELLQLKL